MGRKGLCVVCDVKGMVCWLQRMFSQGAVYRLRGDGSFLYNGTWTIA